MCATSRGSSHFSIGLFRPKMQLIVLVVGFLTTTEAFVPGLYCGTESCYDVLGVSRTATKSELSKKYRKLAMVSHPDRVKGDAAAKKKAAEQFRLIATAYETLKEEESRKDYDYMLDNPDEYYYHYYNYYSRRVAPKVDVRIVIVATILIISIVQYVSACQKYNEAISYLITQPKYRMKAMEIANERKLFADRKKGKKRDKEEEKLREEATLREIIQENIDIQGGYQRPSVMNTLVVNIVLFPYYLFLYVKWWLRWVWLFWIQNHEYEEEEQTYLIRKHLKLTESQFQALPEKERTEMFTKELWIHDNFVVWKAAREEEEKRKLADSGQYKRYRRMMAKGGGGQISFVDEEF